MFNKIGNISNELNIYEVRNKIKGVKVMKKVTISFKETTKDIRLFTIVNSQEEKSDFVKRALEFYIKHFEKQENLEG